MFWIGGEYKPVETTKEMAEDRYFLPGIIHGCEEHLIRVYTVGGEEERFEVEYIYRNTILKAKEEDPTLGSVFEEIIQEELESYGCPDKTGDFTTLVKAWPESIKMSNEDLVRWAERRDMIFILKDDKPCFPITYESVKEARDAIDSYNKGLKSCYGFEPCNYVIAKGENNNGVMGFSTIEEYPTPFEEEPPVVAVVQKFGENDYAVNWVDLPENVSAKVNSLVSDYCGCSVRGTLESIAEEVREKHLYKVPVYYEMYGYVEIEAESEEEAIRIAEEDPGIPLPENGAYVAGSFHADPDGEIIEL